MVAHLALEKVAIVVDVVQLGGDGAGTRSVGWHCHGIVLSSSWLLATPPLHYPSPPVNIVHIVLCAASCCSALPALAGGTIWVKATR